MSDKKRHSIRMCATLDRPEADVILWTDGKPTWGKGSSRWSQYGLGKSEPLARFVLEITIEEAKEFLGIEFEGGETSIVEFDLIVERIDNATVSQTAD